MNDYGISLYLGTGYEYNRYIIKKHTNTMLNMRLLPLIYLKKNQLIIKVKLNHY